MRWPIRFPAFKHLSAQQKINGFCEPLLYHGSDLLVGIAKEPPAKLETVAVILLVLYYAIERHEFACKYFSH